MGNHPAPPGRKFIALPHHVAEHLHTLERADFAVLTVLAAGRDYATDEISQAAGDTASAALIHPKSLPRVLAKLVVLGLVEVVANGVGRGNKPTYKITYEKVTPAQPYDAEKETPALPFAREKVAPTLPITDKRLRRRSEKVAPTLLKGSAGAPAYKESDSSSDSFQKTRRTSPRFDPSTIPIPEAINTPVVTHAWRVFLEHRADLRSAKPLTPAAVRMSLKRLADMGEHRAIAAIEHSVANGWAGIFEPKGQHRVSDKIDSRLQGEGVASPVFDLDKHLAKLAGAGGGGGKGTDAECPPRHRTDAPEGPARASADAFRH